MMRTAGRTTPAVTKHFSLRARVTRLASVVVFERVCTYLLTYVQTVIDKSLKTVSWLQIVYCSFTMS